MQQHAATEEARAEKVVWTPLTRTAGGVPSRRGKGRFSDATVPWAARNALGQSAIESGRSSA